MSIGERVVVSDGRIERPVLRLEDAGPAQRIARFHVELWCPREESNPHVRDS